VRQARELLLESEEGGEGVSHKGTFVSSVSRHGVLGEWL
jgi:hypothetical protein